MLHGIVILIMTREVKHVIWDFGAIFIRNWHAFGRGAAKHGPNPQPSLNPESQS